MTEFIHPSQKIRIGWFSFTCCEDSTIIFTELLNDHYKDWKNIVEFTNFKTIRKNNSLDNLDIAFVEGAISSETQAEKLKTIRNVSKKLVAIGACAVTGMPSSQRNLFDEQTTVEIKPILERFSYLPKVKKPSEIVPIDVEVGGCPMNEEDFLKVFNALLKEFGVI